MTEVAARRGPSLASDVAATLAVAAFSLAVAVGFARVFAGWSFLTDMAVVIAVGHGVGLLTRRLRLSAWIGAPLTALALTWVVLVVFYPDTFAWALPTGETWSVIEIQLTSVRDEFRTAIAPVIYGGGWDLLAMIGLATGVLLADVFAFRAEARAEALVPGGVLFIFVGALSDERLRVASAIVIVGAGVVTTVVLRSMHTVDERDRPLSVTWRRWPVAVAFGLAVAVIAGFVGPRLPGADAAPLYETSGRGGGVTNVISPLVDIRSRLTNRSGTELFTVEAAVESYWRSAALPSFDGTTWGLPERELERVDPSRSAPDGATIENRQRVTIAALSGALVPAAPDPFQASGPDDLRWVPETSTLVTVDGDLESGDVIDIVSAAPVLDAAALATRDVHDPGDPIYTAVPSDLPGVVADTAREVTAGAESSYDAAILLQDWFQSEFDYSLDVQSGHGASAIENFLRDRVGYCEQFAGTYAAMMRTLGVPARVAVGFTSGIAVADGVYSVLGRNAHAWPEVWFDDIGWVAFEPTPGRGAPNAEGYTGISPQQDTSTDVEGGQPAGAPPTTVRGASRIDGQLPDIPAEFADPTGTGSSTGAALPDGRSRDTQRWWLGALALLTAVIAAPSMRSIGARSRCRYISRRAIGRAWRRAAVAASDAGVVTRPSDTPIEVAAATARRFPMVKRPMTSLAVAVTEATYSPEGADGLGRTDAYGTTAVGECRNWAKQIERTVSATLTWQQRLRIYFTRWS